MKRTQKELEKSILVFDGDTSECLLELSHGTSQDDLCFALSLSLEKVFFKDYLTQRILKSNEGINDHVMVCERTVEERLIHLRFKDKKYSFNLTQVDKESVPLESVLKHAQFIFDSEAKNLELIESSTTISNRIPGRCYPNDIWELKN